MTCLHCHLCGRVVFTPERCMLYTGACPSRWWDTTLAATKFVEAAKSRGHTWLPDAVWTRAGEVATDPFGSPSRLIDDLEDEEELWDVPADGGRG